MSQPPLPDPDWDLIQPFWNAAREGSLVMPRCGGCQRYVWYPDEQCPHCGAGEIPWVAVAGRGQLFSWAEVCHPLHPPYADSLPYLTGIVVLDEDPTLRYVTRFVDCTADDLAIEMPMEVVFRELVFTGVEGSVMAPLFRPLP